MENAVDALKIAFAILVFSLALILLFNVVGQVKATSDIVFQLNDKTGSYEYITANDYNTNEDRIVGFETILPTIYRYEKEQYAVTIVDSNGKPIVRFDLYTEGFMGDWNDILKKREHGTPEEKDTANTVYNGVAERLAKVDEIINSNEENKLINQINKGNLYGVVRHGSNTITGIGQNIVSAPWTGSSESEVINRIQADITGSTYTRNNISYKGVNLLQYNQRQFIEKFIEIETSGEIVKDGEDSLETIRANRKLEIIYIMK